MKRLPSAFAARSGRTGLIPFVVAGYPSLEGSLEILKGFAHQGALAVEVGIPFSDPIADGPDIQRASEAAIASGIGLADVFHLVREIRRVGDLPVVLMTYTNPVARAGIEEFAEAAVEAGVDGVLLSDLPPDEAPELWEPLERAGLDRVVLVAPTTDESRLPLLLERASGFVYCLARTGVTGAGPGESGSLPDRVGALRRHTRLPVAVGFGISEPRAAAALRGVADAVVVGAAFVRAAARGEPAGATERVLTLSGDILAALDATRP